MLKVALVFKVKTNIVLIPYKRAVLFDLAEMDETCPLGESYVFEYYSWDSFLFKSNLSLLDFGRDRLLFLF